MIDNTLKGLKHAESYIDDCITYSRTFQEHIADLGDVLELLIQAKMHVKFRKSQLVHLEVEFLGHLVSGNGRRSTPNAVQRLAKIPKPRCVK